MSAYDLIEKERDEAIKQRDDLLAAIKKLLAIEEVWYFKNEGPGEQGWSSYKLDEARDTIEATVKEIDPTWESPRG